MWDQAACEECLAPGSHRFVDKCFRHFFFQARTKNMNKSAKNMKKWHFGRVILSSSSEAKLWRHVVFFTLTVGLCRLFFVLKKKHFSLSMMSFFFYSFSTAPLLSLLFLFLSSSVRFFFVCTNDLPRNDETTKWFAFFLLCFSFFRDWGY